MPLCLVIFCGIQSTFSFLTNVQSGSFNKWIILNIIETSDITKKIYCKLVLLSIWEYVSITILSKWILFVLMVLTIPLLSPLWLLKSTNVRFVCLIYPSNDCYHHYFSKITCYIVILFFMSIVLSINATDVVSLCYSHIYTLHNGMGSVLYSMKQYS